MAPSVGFRSALPNLRANEPSTVGRHLWRHIIANIDGLKPDLQLVSRPSELLPFPFTLSNSLTFQSDS